jgi:iron(III) transport system substrate-binding protein
MRKFFALSLVLVLGMMTLAPISAQEESTETLVLYSGRNEALIQPIIDRFTEETGVQVDVRYGNTAGLANQLIEEGENTPADVYLGQDAGALGALAKAGLLTTLSGDITARVPQVFRDVDNQWVGLSGRARVLVYNPATVEAAGVEFPASILDLVNEEYAGLVGWAPTNASLQAQVTALRVLVGEEETAAWLEGMVANGVTAYGNNRELYQAVIDGEIPFGISNHYYLFSYLAENPDTPAFHYFFPAGDPGSLINIAGIGVINTTAKNGLAERLVLYLIGAEAQQYFADQTYEYPVIEGVAVNERLVPLSEIEAPEINLSDLDDLATTLEMIEASGALD